MYTEGMKLVNKGMFSNFSDLVRTGIREEFKELNPLMQNYDEQEILNDKKLIVGVKQSVKESRAGKGKILKSDKEMDRYFKRL